MKVAWYCLGPGCPHRGRNQYVLDARGIPDGEAPACQHCGAVLVWRNA